MAVPFSNTKLRVPAGFRNVLEGFSREVLRNQPNDIYSFGSIYFDRLLQIRAESGYDPVEVGAREEDRMYNSQGFTKEALSAEKSMDRLTSALKIQTKFRQHLAKKTVKEMRQERAAVKIQAVFRGHLGRNIYHYVKEASQAETERAKHSAEAEDAEEEEQEGDGPSRFFIADVPDEKEKEKKTDGDDHSSVANASSEPGTPGGSRPTDSPAAASSEEESKKAGEEKEELIGEMEDAAARIQAGMRGLLTRMTLKGQQGFPFAQSGEEEEEEVMEVGKEGAEQVLVTEERGPGSHHSLSERKPETTDVKDMKLHGEEHEVEESKVQ